jgi:hypothetical protein
MISWVISGGKYADSSLHSVADLRWSVRSQYCSAGEHLGWCRIRSSICFPSPCSSNSRNDFQPCVWLYLSPPGKSWTEKRKTLVSGCSNERAPMVQNVHRTHVYWWKFLLRFSFLLASGCEDRRSAEEDKIQPWYIPIAPWVWSYNKNPLAYTPYKQKAETERLVDQEPWLPAGHFRTNKHMSSKSFSLFYLHYLQLSVFLSTIA